MVQKDRQDPPLVRNVHPPLSTVDLRGGFAIAPRTLISPRENELPLHKGNRDVSSRYRLDGL